MGKLIQYQVSLHLSPNDVSIDSTITIAFGIIGTLLAIYGIFIAYKQLKMMRFASRRNRLRRDGSELPQFHVRLEHIFVADSSRTFERPHEGGTIRKEPSRLE
ncbi:hypothetical protein NA56DRAFT_746356 [Hyaloscypha hepaticicola]|uniref:Uncharacterized protein n=1 Tax=Hyaloscypha hepaticicola TaxID=2082293 RepID=A0A2J6QD51_9HELO|nr:hypothetical protein NA56DRAFT_746356 [Hyaloscypha hepaticicola]